MVVKVKPVAGQLKSLSRLFLFGKGKITTVLYCIPELRSHKDPLLKLPQIQPTCMVPV